MTLKGRIYRFMFNCHNSLLSPVTVLFIPACYELTLLALLPAKKAIFGHREFHVQHQRAE